MDVRRSRYICWFSHLSSDIRHDRWIVFAAASHLAASFPSVYHYLHFRIQRPVAHRPADWAKCQFPILPLNLTSAELYLGPSYVFVVCNVKRDDACVDRRQSPRREDIFMDSRFTFC